LAASSFRNVVSIEPAARHLGFSAVAAAAEDE
jgi:hypothetical protein